MNRLTARERVLTALRHETPDRVPFAWGFCATPEMEETLTVFLARQGLDWTRLREHARDTITVGPDYIGPPPADGNIYTGIWGIRLKQTDYGGGSYEEFTDFPLAGVEDPAALDRYPWPDPAAYDYASLRAMIERRNPGRLKATQSAGMNLFETYCWMTGLEEAMVNVIANPAVVRRALEYITAFFEERLKRTLTAAGDLIDIVFLTDDLGSQMGLLMARDMYRQMLQPFHRRLIECARAHAPHVKCMFHTDGAVFEIVPDLLDAGIDILEAVQTDAEGMSPERLKAAYGNRLSFHGGISVQKLLPHNDADTVFRECRRLVEVFGKNGGYIAAPAHAIQVGTPPENVLAMLRAVLGETDYAAVVEQALIR